MADPLWLPEVLRAEGLPVNEFPGWRDRGHGDFGGIWGVIAHHTGASGTPGPGVIANHPTLGLASQLHLSRDGVYTVCGAGIAWHAGQGSWPGLPRDNANSCTIGIEAENSGTEGWSPRQYDAYVRGVAAILRHLGRDASHVIGHKEWAAVQGKWDPGGIDMADFRRDVQAAIDRTPEAAGGNDMALEETFENYKGDTVTLGTAVHYLDKHVNEIREQLGGPQPFNGWPQLGNRTLVDALAMIGAALGLDGFEAPADAADPDASKRGN